jgi:cell division protease FtsH
VSTGAQNDLQRATDMARHMITQYGMSQQLGQVVFDPAPQSPYLNLPEPARRGGYSERTAELIDQEIATLINEAHVRVRKTLTEQRATLDALAALLLQHEVVERPMLEALLRAPQGPAAAGPPAAAPTAA